jgi:transposase
MIQDATPIHLSPEERAMLEHVVRSPSSEHRLVERARIVLLAADGKKTRAIAAELSTWPGRVSRWRIRYAAAGFAGLDDAPRPGPKPIYGAATERRVLALLDEAPPSGYGRWTGPLLAKALGDVSDDEVWRILRRNKISLRQRKSWCESTDPDFVPKAAEIVALYLNPPENALVLSVDEKPSIQALERAQGYLKLPNGRALTGYAHEYKRHGTTTLFAALNVATGEITSRHYRRRRRREFLDFMNGVVAEHDDREIHVIIDNLNTHKPKRDRWLAAHPNVQFHFTPTHASWLNQIECWFSILSRSALTGTSFTSPKQVREAIDAFISAYNQTAAPFEWKKAVVHQKSLKPRYRDLRK